MVDSVKYRQKIKKKKVLATKPAIDNSIPVRFKTQYFLQLKKFLIKFTAMLWLRIFSYQFHQTSTGKHFQL